MIEAIQKNQELYVRYYAFFLGGLGIHRFYVGKVGTGLLYLFTGGLFLIGTIIDFSTILFGKIKDKEEKTVTPKTYPILCFDVNSSA
ncbi:MAG: TM2 domain-containing protein [Bacillota bacterium]|nr:TM2 domain-containing protein [Bacillota bacterium]